MSDLTSLDFVRRQADKMSSQQRAAEYWNCRTNPFYFIFNYVYIQEIGGILKYEAPMMHAKMKRVVKSFYNYHRCICMASRQLGKALFIDELLPTPNGLRPIKDICVGDYVYDEHHSPTKVVAVTEIMNNHECYELVISNTKIICDKDHLWKISCDALSLVNVVLTAEQIFNLNKMKMQCTIYDHRLNQNLKITSICKTKSVPVKCIQVENHSGMFLVTANKIPTHNSTIAAAILEWAANFYSNMPITILNATKKFAFENLEKIKFMHMAVADFLRTPLKYKGDRKTTLDYKNESIVRIFYPSSTTSPNTLARSFTSPILYIDEGAHIRHMKVAYAAAQPTLSRAREQAIKHNYPYGILITSTPNGSIGDGEWFYDMYNNGVDSDDLFDANGNLVPNSDELVANPDTNGFVKVKFHWSEDPMKDDNWYREQCRDFNFDTRSINQELDLVFVGSTNCIFTDDFLSKLKAKPIVDRIDLPHITDLKLYTHRDDLDKTDYLLIGVDTAKSITGDFSAIEIYTYSNFKQIGEFFGRLGSLTKYSEIIKKLVDSLETIMDKRIILCIENNSIGTAIIEDLETDENDKYAQYIYSPNPQKYIGINTNKSVKNTMISFYYDLIVNNPENLSSDALIDQLNLIERHVNGTIKGSKDDLFMASVLCAYVRKLSALEIEPLLGLSTMVQQQQNAMTLKRSIASTQIESPLERAGIKVSYNPQEGGIEYNISADHLDDDVDGSDYVCIF